MGVRWIFYIFHLNIFITSFFLCSTGKCSTRFSFHSFFLWSFYLLYTVTMPIYLCINFHRRFNNTIQIFQFIFILFRYLFINMMQFFFCSLDWLFVQHHFVAIFTLTQRENDHTRKIHLYTQTKNKSIHLKKK